VGGINGHFIIVPSVDTHPRSAAEFFESFSPLDDGCTVPLSRDDAPRALVFLLFILPPFPGLLVLRCIFRVLILTLFLLY